MMESALLDGLPVNRIAVDAAQPAWLGEARRMAAGALARDGLPSTRDEAWKYTNLRALAQRPHVHGDSASGTRVVAADAFALPGVDGPRLVFVNGAWRADLSYLPVIEGLSVLSLADALVDDADALRAFLETGFDDASQAFARLNTVLAADGAVVRVAANVRVDARVHLVFFGATAEAAIAWNARVLVELAEGASLTLVEHHLGDDGETHLGNLVSQFALRPRARLDLLQLQQAPETATRIRRSEAELASDAELHLRTLEIGAQLSRHDLVVRLAGDRARLVSHGVFMPRGRQHVDTHIDVRHVARGTASQLLWRGVADQRARGVFHGAITVEPGADGADANLSNKNLLLSAQAEIDTQPVLEIHADEVKAAHGATIGQLDEQALFYLRTRGLPEDEARAMLTLAFCRVAVESFENLPLREHIDRLLLDRLPQAHAAAPGPA